MLTLRTGDPFGDRGYTLFELLIVLAILGISIAVLAPPVARGPGLQLRSGTSLVAAVLREARSLAIRDNRELKVIVDIGARTLQVDSGGDERKLEGDLELSVYTATSELQDAKRGAIRFFPDGTSTGGRIRLSSQVQANDVAVNWLTGHVEIHENVR
jgi:general secretion pathway protein H